MCDCLSMVACPHQGRWVAVRMDAVRSSCGTWIKGRDGLLTRCRGCDCDRGYGHDHSSRAAGER